VTAAESDDERRAKGLPPAPRLPGEELEQVDPPRPVQISFWLWVVAGVVQVLNYVLLVVNRQQITDAVLKGNTDQRVSADQLASGVTVAVTIALIGAVSFAALFLLFAYKARQGTRSARTVLTVLFVLGVVIQLALGLLWVYVALLSVLIGLIALVLMYLPTVWPYFPKVGRSKT
jgi:ABC-type Fe3+ transport system permease subunit